MRNNCHRDKEKRIQCKDVSTLGILRFIKDHASTTFYNLPVENSLWNAVPAEIVPRCVLRMKMYRLVKNGYVSGCACGCRGDFKITPKGAALLTKLSTVRADSIHAYLAVDLETIRFNCVIFKRKGQTVGLESILTILSARGDHIELLKTLRQTYHLRAHIQNWYPLFNSLKTNDNTHK